MHTTPLRSDGPPVARIGLGMAAVGRPGYLNLGHGTDLDGVRSVEGLRAHAHRLLDHAEQRGIRYLDAARSYGLAEDFVGTWLRAQSGRRTSMTVGSKWGYTYTAGWEVDAEVHEVKDHSIATYRRQVAQTRAALGGDPWLYQIHSATLDTGVLDDPEVMAALSELAASGVVVGLSLSGPGQAATLAHALAQTEAGRAPFSAVQATWNLLEPSVGPMLLAARGAGWTVIVKEAVANGRLTPRAPVPASLRAEAGSRGATVDAVAIAAALAQPFTSVVLSGASTIDQLDSNLAAVDIVMSPAEADALAAELAEPPEAYWSHRSALDWT